MVMLLNASASRRRVLACVACIFAFYFLLQLGSSSAFCFSPQSRGTPIKQVPHSAIGSAASGSETAQIHRVTWTGTSFLGFIAILVATGFVVRGGAMRAGADRQHTGDDDFTVSRRSTVIPAALTAAGVTGAVSVPAFAVEVDVPDRINSDPYQLIGMENPDNEKADRAEFYMKKQYKSDTYQVLKHMKISGSLDKGTPNMEKWNKRIKEEMNDWVALYRRQEAVVGRQSYYSLYSAVNTLASHFTSYGPKFPFPSKRRPRFYELINTTEKYLEKGK